MKKTNRIILCLFFLFLIFTFSYAQQQESPPVKLNKISDNLYEILDGRGANGGVLIGDDAVLVIDAKMDKKSVDETLEGIKQLTDKPVRYLVNTHSDRDHVQGNRYFPETVTIIAQENCRKEFLLPTREGTQSDWNKPEFIRFLPSITFRDKMEIYIGSKKIELWHFGTGHTTGDAVIYFPDAKTAWIGDLVFLTRPQLIHSYKGGSSVELVRTLTKMLTTLDAEQFYSGHSEKTDRNGIINYIEQMKERQGKVKAMMASGKTLEQIKSEFKKEEAALIEVIYNEIKKGST